MRVYTFHCPHCSTPLRLKGRSLLHRTISCPECKQSVRIGEAAGGGLCGVADAPGDAPTEQPRTAARPAPSTVAWSVATLLTLSIVGFLTVPFFSDSQATPKAHRDESGAAAGEEQGPMRPPDPAMAVSPLEEQLVDWHGRFAPTLERNGRFPTGTVVSEQRNVDERLSWLASVMATAEPTGPQPRWDRAWNDPANDRFVRRRQPLLLNPAWDTLVGTDGYPATHFVGVAGVGEDAAVLPTGHPRAGIFGNDRDVRLMDVADGLTNTLLMAGVQSRHGSWAAGGEATVRGFTAEPYLRGPDGFGTGQDQGMHVLMADGSVRFLAKETSPILIRRLAAMSDGHPLDLSVPGDPGRGSDPIVPLLAGDPAAPAAHENPVAPNADAGDLAGPVGDAVRVIAEIAHSPDQPIEVPMAESAVVYDTATALKQRILKFDQSKPVPARDLMQVIEEMAAVPIRFEELPAEFLPRLATPVTVSLKSTTVGEILQAIVDRAELSFQGRTDGIIIRPPSEEP